LDTRPKHNIVDSLVIIAMFFAVGYIITVMFGNIV